MNDFVKAGTDGIASAREDWTQAGYTEADFDGYLHPNQQFERLLLVLERVKALLVLSESNGTVILMNTGTNVLVLRVEEGSFSEMDYRNVIPFFSDRVRENTVSRIEIWLLDSEQSCDIGQEEAAIYMNAFFTQEIIEPQSLKES
ncbi:MAG: hypothetical protein KBS85_02520 [Lachnospiraceae bacterium]|nr:hypothetical protein [Candidatus Merdinaster equi]